MSNGNKASTSNSMEQRNENLRKLFATNKKQNSTILQNKSVSDNNLRNEITRTEQRRDPSSSRISMPTKLAEKNEPLQRDWALSQSNGCMAYPANDGEGDDHDDGVIGVEDNMSVARPTATTRNRRSSSQIRRWQVRDHYSMGMQSQMPKSGSCLALVAPRAKTADVDEEVAGNQFSMMVKKPSNQSYGSDINLNTSIQQLQHDQHHNQHHHHQGPHHFVGDANRRNAPVLSGLNNNYRESCPEVHSITTPKSRRPSLQWYKRKNWLSQEENNAVDEVCDSGHTSTNPLVAMAQPLGDMGRHAAKAYNQFERGPQSNQYSRELSAKTDCIVGNTIDDDGNNNYYLYSANTQQWPRATNYIGSHGENYIRDDVMPGCGVGGVSGVGVGPRRPRAHSYGYYSNELLKSLDSDEDNADEADVVDNVVGYYSHGNVVGQEKKIMTKAVGKRNYNDHNSYNYKGYDVNENSMDDNNNNSSSNKNNSYVDDDEDYDAEDGVVDDYVAGDDSEFELLGSEDDEYVDDDDVSSGEQDGNDDDDDDGSVIDGDIQTTADDGNLNKNQQSQFSFQPKQHASVPATSATTSTSKRPSSVAELMKIRLKPKTQADRVETSPTIITNFMSPITSSSASASAVAVAVGLPANDPQSLSQHSGLIKNSCVQNNFICQENKQQQQHQPHLMLKEIGNSSTDAAASTASRQYLPAMNNATSDDDNARILLHGQTTCQNKYTFHGPQQHLPGMPAVVAAGNGDHNGSTTGNHQPFNER